MPLVGEERREFQRLRLEPALPGNVGNTDVAILEIGVLGARVHHTEPFDVQYADLHFSHDGTDIGLRCEIIRTFPSETRLESGLRFLSAIDGSGDKLREMLARLVMHEFAVRRRLTTRSIPFPTDSPVDGDKTVRGKDANFLCYRLDKGIWSKKRVFLPEQPLSGFTVAQTADSDEINRLCRIYEVSDEEGRRLIRLFAELSVSDVLQIPPSM